MEEYRVGEYSNNNSTESEGSFQSLPPPFIEMDGEKSIGGCRVKVQSQVGYNHIRRVYVLRLKVTDMIMYKGNGLLRYPQKIDILLSHDIFEKTIKPKGLKECLLFYNSTKHCYQEVELVDVNDYVIVTKDGESLPGYAFYSSTLHPKAYEFFFEFRLKYLLQYWCKENDISTYKSVSTISYCPRKGSSSILVQILYKIQFSRNKKVIRVWDGSIFKKGVLVKIATDENKLEKLGFVTNDTNHDMKDASNFGTDLCKYCVDIVIPQKLSLEVWDKIKPGDWILFKNISSFETYKHNVKFLLPEENKKENILQIYTLEELAPFSKQLSALAFAIQRKSLYYNCLKISLNIFDIKNFNEELYVEENFDNNQVGNFNESPPNFPYLSISGDNNTVPEGTNNLLNTFFTTLQEQSTGEIVESKSPKSSSCSMASDQSTGKKKQFYGVEEFMSGSALFVRNHKKLLIENIKTLENKTLTILLCYFLTARGRTSITISMIPENTKNIEVFELLYRHISDIFENNLSNFKKEAFSKGNGGDFNYEIIFKLKDDLNYTNAMEISINFNANIKKVTSVKVDIDDDIISYEPVIKKTKT
uniref:AAA domain-containing protein n=1 Tax=Strongyloides venezuelensis TaxID=75913 RepID=A0A0K0G3Z1_STRVS